MFPGVAPLVLLFALGSQAAGAADMTHFTSPGERAAAVTVVAEDGGLKIEIPQRRRWLHILPCLVMLLISAALLAPGLRDLIALRLSFFTVFVTLLAGVFTAGSGAGALWLMTGREVLRVKLGSFESAREILGRRIGKPQLYTGPIRDVQIQDSVGRGEGSYGVKLVLIRFLDDRELRFRSFLEESEAGKIADAIRSHDPGPKLKEVSKEEFKKTYFKHGQPQEYWDHVSQGARNRYFIAPAATPQHTNVLVRADDDNVVRLCFYAPEGN